MANRPPVPSDGGERLVLVLLRPGLFVGADRAPPIVTLEAFLRVARINHHPAGSAGSECAVPVPDELVVSVCSALVRRVQVCLHVGVRSHDDAVVAAVVGHCVKRGLNRLERLRPGGAVRVVPELRDKQHWGVVGG